MLIMLVMLSFVSPLIIITILNKINSLYNIISVYNINQGKHCEPLMWAAAGLTHKSCHFFSHIGLAVWLHCMLLPESKSSHNIDSQAHSQKSVVE